MTKRLSVRELRANLSDVLGAVFYTHEPVVVEKKGRPVAVVLSPEQYERFQQDQRERFFQAVDELQRLNADEDPDTLLQDVTAIVEQVRQERHGRQQLDPGDR